MKKYISEIDGKVFETKDELLDYLELQYVKVEELIEDSKYSQVLSKLKSAFPKSNIEVTEVNPNEIHVELSFKVNNDLVECFRFEISNEEKLTYHKIFENVEDAIKFYSLYPKQTELIREALANNYNLESFKIIQWFESDGYNSYHHINLEVVLNGKLIDIKSGLFQDVKDVIKYEVEPYFTNVITGKPRYNGQGEWEIGNYDLYKLLNRAKKVSLTIIE